MIISAKKINQKSSNPIIALFKKDMVFTISFVLALITSFMYTPKLDYIDFKVLFSLFNLMIVVKAFEKLKILDQFAISLLNRCSNTNKISLCLIGLCFFSSMLLTNDVALITFVPLTLIIGKKSNLLMLDTIIFQTLAANIGSSLTPMGNPQNLFIFSHYHLTSVQFFQSVIFFVILGGFWLYVLNSRLDSIDLNVKLDSIQIKNKGKSILWMVLFFIIILSILGAINYKFALILTILMILFLDQTLLFKIDYLLLLTFVCFFIFIGNISHMDQVHIYMTKHLNSPIHTYFISIGLSQLISNVPACILLSGFTNDWKALLLGVNIGGLGTLVASLASVISYKLFIQEHPQNSKKYMLKFSIYNLLGLSMFTIINYFILRFV